VVKVAFIDADAEGVDDATVLPDASLTTKVISPDTASAGRSADHDPSAATGTSIDARPATVGYVTVTVAPGPTVTVTFPETWIGTPVVVGPLGTDWLNGTCIGEDTFPSASVTVTDTNVPADNPSGVVIPHVPSALTIGLPNTEPCISDTVTIVPGTPSPAIT